MKRTIRLATAMALAVCVGGWMSPAWATWVPDASICFSGPTTSDSSLDYTVFDALIEYSYSANVLTMLIHNDTVSPDVYTLSELMFNVSSDVTGLSILNDGALTGTSLTTNVHQGSMGTFDYDFDLGSGNNGIPAGNSQTVTFNVTGSNLDYTDFFNGLSTAPGDGNGHFVASIHFTRGPDDASNWVTPCSPVVPEPATISLLGMGLAGLVARRLRKRA